MAGATEGLCDESRQQRVLQILAAPNPGACRFAASRISVHLGECTCCSPLASVCFFVGSEFA